MKLIAILSWWEESPSWLMATVMSLPRLGVSHVVAVDGAYPGIEGATRWSGMEQSEAVSLAADAAGIGLTLHRPDDLLSERDKRSVCFDLAIAVGTPMRDWVTVIDADEVVVVEADMPRQLAGTDLHVAGAKLVEAIDPAATEGKNNTPQTPGIYRALDLNHRGEHWQSRFFRLMPEMWVQDTHYSYHGRDDTGKVWNLRPDIGGASVGEPCQVFMPEIPPFFEHRDPWRTAYRKRIKTDYYNIRNRGGWEEVPEQHRYTPHDCAAT